MDKKYGKELSLREKEVLKYVEMGMTNNQIAKNLFVSHHTIKAHLASIFRKLDAVNRTQAICIYKELERK